MKVKRAVILFLTFFMILSSGLSVSAHSGTIRISDPALEAFIRREIQKPEGSILDEDIASLTSIDTTT